LPLFVLTIKYHKMKCLFYVLFLVLFVSPDSYAQTNDATLPELKEAYLKKRTKFMDSSTKKFSDVEQTELNGILDQIEGNGPESFEYYLISYVHSNYNLDLKENLFKAYTLNSTDKTVVSEMLGYYIMTENLVKQKEFVQKTQKNYTAAELAYYQDAMPTGNVVLITANQEDMYAFLGLKMLSGIGAEVSLVNLDFLKNSTYKKSISTFAGITDANFLGAESSYIKTLISGSTKKVFVSTTVSQAYLSNVEDKMYLTGLTYQYGAGNQRTLLDNFWTMMKTKDLSKFVLSKSSEKNLYGNYLPPLLTLYKLKLSEGTEDIVLANTIKIIAEKIGKKEVVDDILYQYLNDE